MRPKTRERESDRAAAQGNLGEDAMVFFLGGSWLNSYILEYFDRVFQIWTQWLESLKTTVMQDHQTAYFNS